tara:strand:+ start:1298 stop:2458 length:1161 start_codon:yes stop_codon:yes gene_type:complete
MDFSRVIFEDDYKSIRDSAKSFASEIVAPRAKQIDEEDKFFFDIIKKAGEMGILGIELPQNEGGAGADAISSVITTEEIASFSPVVASTIGAMRTHIMLLNKFGTQDQKKELLPRLVNGEGIAALGITEPNAGSDLSCLETTAKRKRDVFILNGSKTYTSFGNICDFIFVLAYTNKDLGTRNGMTLFIVKTGTKGLKVGPEEQKLGLRGMPLVSLTFDNLELEKENILGEEGNGFPQLMNCFDATRTDVAAQAIGISKSCLKICREYSSVRTQFNRPLIDFQAIQWMLVDMDVEIAAGRLLMHQAAHLRSQKSRCSREASRAKLFCSDNAMKHATNAIQILGGYGYLKSSPIEMLFRDAKVLQIYDGTNQIQRIILAREISKDEIK